MSLADYLAKNYLTADQPQKSKKRKRKPANEGTVVVIDDDEPASDWRRAKDAQDGDDDGGPLTGMLFFSFSLLKWRREMVSSSVRVFG
jgi:pre-mRNA-splicing factor CWC26